MSAENTFSSGNHSPPLDRPKMSLRLVLVGKSGAGKSSSGNIILGKKVFREGHSGRPITTGCRREETKMDKRKVVVVDTPDLFDTTRSGPPLGTPWDLGREINRCRDMTAPSLHAIIMVIRAGNFTAEERLSVEKVRAIFGEEAVRYTMVLFNGGDELTGDIKEHLPLCGDRHHVFDNTSMKNRKSEVLELLKNMDKMVAANGGEFDTSPLYQDVERMLTAKEQEIRQLQEKERQFDEERRRLQENIEELKQNAQEKEMKLKELERYTELNEQERMEYGWLDHYLHAAKIMKTDRIIYH